MADGLPAKNIGDASLGIILVAHRLGGLGQGDGGR